jgi:hypothetical protein
LPDFWQKITSQALLKVTSNKIKPLTIADEGFYLMNPQDLEQEKGEVTALRNQNIYLGMAHLEV